MKKYKHINLKFKNKIRNNKFFFYHFLRIVLFLISLIYLPDSKIAAQSLTKADTSNVHFLNSRKFYIYKVEKGETLFNISQKFKISQEEIMQLNHDIEKIGLKPKMKLWIPAYSWIKRDSLPEAIEKVDRQGINIYHIAVVTSFSLPKIYLAHDSSDFYIDEALSKEVKDNLEFVEGILFGTEAMKTEGFRVHLDIIDSENDSIKLMMKLLSTK